MKSKGQSSDDLALYSLDEECHNELLHSLQQHHQRARLDHPGGRLPSPVLFTDVWVSDLALTKMLMHAESGGRIEVMGLLLGKAAVFSQNVALSSSAYEDDMRDSSDGEGLQQVKKGYFVVTDCFALPVEGTETRVNAAEEANEYMIEYLEAAEKIPTPQKVVGWYHSHPNYGCWLSGIDVRTQQLQQQHQDPFLAIVVRLQSQPLSSLPQDRVYAALAALASLLLVDPIRTLSNGRVEEVAFHFRLLAGRRTCVCERRYYELRTHFCSNSISSRLLGNVGETSWSDVLFSSTLRRNRPLEFRRLETVVDACQDVVKSLHPSNQGSTSDKGMKADYDASDSVGPPDFSEELGVLQVKTMSQKLAGIGEQAGEMAVRALTALVETANIVSRRPLPNALLRPEVRLCGGFTPARSAVLTSLQK
ncbi:hypothetical protein ACSSS7_004017 [Eimeria intestinalis]